MKIRIAFWTLLLAADGVVRPLLAAQAFPPEFLVSNEVSVLAEGNHQAETEIVSGVGRLTFRLPQGWVNQVSGVARSARAPMRQGTPFGMVDQSNGAATSVFETTWRRIRVAVFGP